MSILFIMTIMHATTENPVSIEKSYTLKFLKSNPAVETDEAHWTWTPVKHRGSLDIKTATFSGKNQADDYTNE